METMSGSSLSGCSTLSMPNKKGRPKATSLKLIDCEKTIALRFPLGTVFKYYLFNFFKFTRLGTNSHIMPHYLIG